MNRKFEKRAEVRHSSLIASRHVVSKASQQKALMKKKREALRRASPTQSNSPTPNSPSEADTEATDPVAMHVVLEQTPELVDQALHALFNEFDTNASGHITLKEVKEMLISLPERTGTKDCVFDDVDAERIMTAFDGTFVFFSVSVLRCRSFIQNVRALFDAIFCLGLFLSFAADGNGEIEEEEFNGWIKKGLSRTRKERDEFAEKTQLAKKISAFLDCMEDLIRASIAKEKQGR